MSWVNVKDLVNIFCSKGETTADQLSHSFRLVCVWNGQERLLGYEEVLVWCKDPLPGSESQIITVWFPTGFIGPNTHRHWRDDLFTSLFGSMWCDPVGSLTYKCLMTSIYQCWSFCHSSHTHTRVYSSEVIHTLLRCSSLTYLLWHWRLALGNVTACFCVLVSVWHVDTHASLRNGKMLMQLPFYKPVCPLSCTDWSHRRFIPSLKLFTTL